MGLNGATMKLLRKIIQLIRVILEGEKGHTEKQRVLREEGLEAFLNKYSSYR